MRSSVGLRSLQLRLQLWLAAVALSALALSLGLAFAAATVPRAAAKAHGTPANASIAAPVMRSPVVPPAVTNDQSPPLWTLLARWTYTVDAIALLGFVAVVVVRRNTRRRRGTETEPRWP
jgi:hypothetical protein